METIASTAAQHQGVPQPKGFPGLPSGWQSQWETFESPVDGTQLFEVRHVRGKGGPTALFIVHGFGEHGGRYLHVPHYVGTAVDMVVCPDHRGHGRSAGLRGHVNRFDDYVEDMAFALKRLEERLIRDHGKARIHLLGHSMGGTISLRLLLQHPEIALRSATICAPLLGVAVKVPLPKLVVGRILAKVWGSVQMANGIDVTAISHDPAVQETYKADRLVHAKVTPRWFTQLEDAMADTLSRVDGVRVPTQFVIPLEDRVVDPEKGKAYAEAFAQDGKRVQLYEGCRHEAFNESGPKFTKERAFKDLVSWIHSHT